MQQFCVMASKIEIRIFLGINVLVPGHSLLPCCLYKVCGVEGSLSVTSQLTKSCHVCVFDRNTIEGLTSKCNKL